MGVLHLLAYGGGLAAFLFVTLSLASGLLWLAELIEEHSRYAKTIGMRAIYTIIGLHVLLVFTDSLPILPTLLSIAAHLVYLSNFSSSWPYISLTSPRFLLSCLFVVTDHFTWFFHFAAKAQEAKKYRGPKYRYGANSGARVPDVAPAFMDVAAFFAVCVWFVPLYLFLSLSANDNALPSLPSPDSMASAPPSPSIHPRTIDLNTPQDLHGSGPLPRRRSRAQASTTLVKAALSPLISLLPKLRSSSKRLNDEGFLTPRTPVRGSPLHTPVHMPQSYFPWGGDDPEETMRSALSSASGSSIQRSPSPNYPSLGVADGASSRQRLSIGRLKTPPPPRRVQSEAAGLGMNPRGIATRNGVPASTPVNGNPERSSPPRQDKSGQGTAGGPPKVSLGPKEGEAFAVGEVIDSVDAGKKKAD